MKPSLSWIEWCEKSDLDPTDGSLVREHQDWANGELPGTQRTHAWCTDEHCVAGDMESGALAFGTGTFSPQDGWEYPCAKCGAYAARKGHNIHRVPYSLWLDDERDPAKFCDADQHEIVWAKSSAEALEIVEAYGPPEFLYLDHDLGGDDTSIVFLRKFCLTNAFVEYRVHSANPVGAANIKSFMESWRRS